MNILETDKMHKIWLQREIPVLLRISSKPLMVKLPYEEGNGVWLRNGRRNRPKWREKFKCWEIPKNWFNDTVVRVLHKYGQTYIIQPYRQQEICAPSCWNATGYECQCSCMGEYHGSQNSEAGWFVVSEAFATRWQGTELACRLLKKR